MFKRSRQFISNILQSLNASPLENISLTDILPLISFENETLIIDMNERPEYLEQAKLLLDGVEKCNFTVAGNKIIYDSGFESKRMGMRLIEKVTPQNPDHYDFLKEPFEGAHDLQQMMSTPLEKERMVAERPKDKTLIGDILSEQARRMGHKLPEKRKTPFVEPKGKAEIINAVKKRTRPQAGTRPNNVKEQAQRELF